MSKDYTSACEWGSASWRQWLMFDESHLFWVWNHGLRCNASPRPLSAVLLCKFFLSSNKTPLWLLLCTSTLESWGFECEKRVTAESVRCFSSTVFILTSCLSPNQEMLPHELRPSNNSNRTRITKANTQLYIRPVLIWSFTELSRIYLSTCSSE